MPRQMLELYETHEQCLDFLKRIQVSETAFEWFQGIPGKTPGRPRYSQTRFLKEVVECYKAKTGSTEDVRVTFESHYGEWIIVYCLATPKIAHAQCLPIVRGKYAGKLASWIGIDTTSHGLIIHEAGTEAKFGNSLVGTSNMSGAKHRYIHRASFKNDALSKKALSYLDEIGVDVSNYSPTTPILEKKSFAFDKNYLIFNDLSAKAVSDSSYRAIRLEPVLWRNWTLDIEGRVSLGRGMFYPTEKRVDITREKFLKGCYAPVWVRHHSLEASSVREAINLLNIWFRF